MWWCWNMAKKSSISISLHLLGKWLKTNTNTTTNIISSAFRQTLNLCEEVTHMAIAFHFFKRTATTKLKVRQWEKTTEEKNAGGGRRIIHKQSKQTKLAESQAQKNSLNSTLYLEEVFINQMVDILFSSDWLPTRVTMFQSNYRTRKRCHDYDVSVWFGSVLCSQPHIHINFSSYS